MARLVITNSSEVRQGFRKKALRTHLRLGSVSLIFTLAVLIAVLSVLQLLHANRVATRGYIIRNLEIEKAQVLNDNQILKMQVARAKSLTSIIKNETTMRMVEVTQPTFLIVGSDLTRAITD